MNVVEKFAGCLGLCWEFYLFKVSIDLFIAINPYAHRNGSQSGIKPNNEFLIKVSTPVLININSETDINKNPKTRKRMSFLFRFIKSAPKIIIMYKMHKT